MGGVFTRVASAALDGESVCVSSVELDIVRFSFAAVLPSRHPSLHSGTDASDFLGRKVTHGGGVAIRAVENQVMGPKSGQVADQKRSLFPTGGSTGRVAHQCIEEPSLDSPVDRMRYSTEIVFSHSITALSDSG